MERESLFMNEANTMLPTYNSLIFGEKTQPNELNCSPEQFPNCLLKSNWVNPMDQRDPFEYALSSMVSSPPVASNTGVPVSNGDSIVLRELASRLVGNSGQLLPESCIGGNNSAGTSCYSTLLNSPPKLNLSIMDQQIRENLPVPGNHLQIHPGLVPFSADPGFVERAARLSCLGNRNYGDPNGQFGLNESELPHRLTSRVESIELSRVSSDRSLMLAGSLSAMGVQENKNSFLQNVICAASDKKYAELGDSPEGSSVSVQIPGGEIGTKGHQDDGGNARKRKSIPRGKSKEIQSSPDAKHAKDASQSDEREVKRSKPDETTGNGSGKSARDRNEKQRKDNSKPPEPPKDYIHVRARRGQATDSHSLAERVRREKISERMKLLQNLVPGCNKVIGKAVMLDEIINYVQSLQRQVEFLSMKIATVNPATDLNMEAPLSYDIFQSSRAIPHIPGMHPLDTLAPALPYRYQSQQGPHLHNGTDSPFSPSSLNNALCRNSSMRLPPIGGFGETASQAQWP